MKCTGLHPDCTVCNNRVKWLMHEKHGETKNGQPRIYRIWRAMRFRCTNPNHGSYHRYGGRGVSVCSEWAQSYVVFKAWALSSGYRQDLSIDRINNDGNYEPSNCRWATVTEQAGNRGESSCIVEVNGVSKSVCAWATETGIYLTTLYRRYRKGIRGTAFLEKTIPRPPKLTLDSIRKPRL